MELEGWPRCSLATEQFPCVWMGLLPGSQHSTSILWCLTTPEKVAYVLSGPTGHWEVETFQHRRNDWCLCTWNDNATKDALACNWDFPFIFSSSLKTLLLVGCWDLKCSVILSFDQRLEWLNKRNDRTGNIFEEKKSSLQLYAINDYFLNWFCCFIYRGGSFWQQTRAERELPMWGY